MLVVVGAHQMLLAQAALVEQAEVVLAQVVLEALESLEPLIPAAAVVAVVADHQQE